MIELAPKRDDIGYKKVVLWLGQADLVPRKLEFFGDAAEPTKRLVQSDVRTVGPIPVAYHTRVETPATGSSTEIDIAETQFNQKLPDEAFTQRALEQGPQ